MQILTQEVIQHFLSLLAERDIECHAINIQQGGNLIYQASFAPFDLDTPHPVFSITKSFTSLAIGFLEQEGKLNTEDIWLDYFPELKEEAADERFYHVTIHHLLTMTLGQDQEVEVLPGEDWIKIVLGKQLTYEPGTSFLYNSYCSHMLSALITKLTNQTIAEYLKPRLFEPLGIQRYYWEKDQQGRSLGGYGLHIRLEDLARFGQCCLDMGMVQGKQVLPENWIKKATSKQASNARFYPNTRSENRQGYGYQFWMCTHGAYRCSGLHGQLCFIQPHNQLVITMFNATSGSQAVLDALFEAMEEQKESLTSIALQIPYPKGKRDGYEWEAMYNTRWTAHQNQLLVEWIRLSKSSDHITLDICKQGNRYSIQAAHRLWFAQKDAFHNFNPFLTHACIQDEVSVWINDQAFGSYAWSNPTTLQIDIREWNHACGTTLILHFDQNHIVMEYKVRGLYARILEATVVFSKP